MIHSNIDKELEIFRIYFGLCIIHVIMIRDKLGGTYEPHLYFCLLHCKTFPKSTSRDLVYDILYLNLSLWRLIRKVFDGSH